MVSAGDSHTVLLRSDGSAVAIGDSRDGQCNIPALDEGLAYTQVSAGSVHTVLLRSDGSAVAIGDSRGGQCDIPPLDEGMAYTQVSAGNIHTVLLRSDGSAVSVGSQKQIWTMRHPAFGRGNGIYPRFGCRALLIEPAEISVYFMPRSSKAGLLRSDGSAVAIGDNDCWSTQHSGSVLED